jgi:transposase InsO family protein
MCDVVPIMNKRGLTASSHCKYYLLITNVKSRVTAPIGISSPSSKHIADALLVWSRDYRPDVTFNLHQVLKLQADAAQAHFAAELTELLTEHRSKWRFAAPRHQNQNGICEQAWQQLIRKIAFKMMAHAHVPDDFCDFVLEHAWKIFNCPPIQDLLQLNGKPCTPLELCTGNKSHLARFRYYYAPASLE